MWHSDGAEATKMYAQGSWLIYVGAHEYLFATMYVCLCLPGNMILIVLVFGEIDGKGANLTNTDSEGSERARTLCGRCSRTPSHHCWFISILFRWRSAFHLAKEFILAPTNVFIVVFSYAGTDER